MNALDVLCAQLTCDLFAIAKFLVYLLGEWKRRGEMGEGKGR